MLLIQESINYFSLDTGFLKIHVLCVVKQKGYGHSTFQTK